MMSAPDFARLALSLPEATEEPHFEKRSFRVKTKIFATLSADGELVCVKLAFDDQERFCVLDETMIYPVPNAWAKQGWTFIRLSRVPQDILYEVLLCAYCAVAPKKLAAQIKDSQ